ncbi:hypothetical protein K432DRAFT_419679 [Lepidopterella palustris CBS 459.81]|uniref:Uncharacterized protein n=1 Tax=Lepidopterella palustris CBS 459.81 TaxID=1314670 RepID=A0A8E2E1U8_9PEZI|nr:hypothetical protein K432DRAFT_419679 [Lepidopterella palustris CBS 459.81]
MQHPIRIGNASGSLGNGVDLIYRLARDLNVEAIVSDYLAEFNIATVVGGEDDKVVHDGEALKPRRFVERDVRAAWASEGDAIEMVTERGIGTLNHLDLKGVVLMQDRGKDLAANVHTGLAGIVCAVEAGADISGLMAGHLIECGAHVTAEKEIDWLRIGHLIADIAANGTSDITMQDHSNGAVTLLLRRDMFVRWLASGASAFRAELDMDAKFALMKDQVREINPVDFTTFSTEDLWRATIYNGMLGCCDMHLPIDWRTMEPRSYVKYLPSLVYQLEIPPTVQFIECTSNIPSQPNYEPQNLFLNIVLFGMTTKVANANVGLWVHDARAWPWLQALLTSKRVFELLGDDWNDKCSIERCELKHPMAVHFVIRGILQDGVSSSSILDGFGKGIGGSSGRGMWMYQRDW